MKKIYKIFLIFFINILVFIFLILISDFTTFFLYSKIYEKDVVAKNKESNHFGYYSQFPVYIFDLNNFYKGKDNTYIGREPDGLEYKNKVPIIVFGCSYAYGLYLNNNQTFSYKLAHILKRPVYNRALPGAGIQQMYYQTKDNGCREFLKTIPYSDTVIYIMLDDHYKRMFKNYAFVSLPYMIHTYSYKNGKFISNNNEFINFLKSSYTVKHFNNLLINNFINNPKNSDKITDIAVKYFEITKNELEKQYGKKIKFYVILYDTLNFLYEDSLTKKLKSKGFIVISTKQLTDENLNMPQYMMKDNFHPKEEAWDLLIPLIIKKLNL